MTGSCRSSRRTSCDSSTSSRSSTPTAAAVSRSGQPAGPGRVRREVRARAARLRRPRVAGRRDGRRSRRRRGDPRARARRERRDPRLEPGRRRTGPPAATAAGQRRPRVRRALPAHPLQRGQDRRRGAAGAPGRTARSRRPRPVVLRLRRLRPRAGQRHRPGTARRLRCDRRAGGDGREPRRPGDAARPAPLPALARRALPAVRELLHAAP